MGTGWPSAGNAVAYFMLPHVSANCHCAAAMERSDDSADASLPRACMWRYSVNEIASTMAMIARTIINSISVKPRADARRRTGAEHERAGPGGVMIARAAA